VAREHKNIERPVNKIKIDNWQWVNDIQSDKKGLF
jgi:hypothetical protein